MEAKRGSASRPDGTHTMRLVLLVTFAVVFGFLPQSAKAAAVESLATEARFRSGSDVATALNELHSDARRQIPSIGSPVFAPAQPGDASVASPVGAGTISDLFGNPTSASQSSQAPGGFLVPVPELSQSITPLPGTGFQQYVGPAKDWTSPSLASGGSGPGGAASAQELAILVNYQAQPSTAQLPKASSYRWVNFKTIPTTTRNVIRPGATMSFVGSLGRLDPRYVRQGSLGDCFFLSAVMAVASVKNGTYVGKLVTPVTVPAGSPKAFQVKLFVGGTWYKVGVDDQVFYAASLQDSFNGWGIHGSQPVPDPKVATYVLGFMTVFEKAYAKLITAFPKLRPYPNNTGYYGLFLGGTIQPVLTAITGLNPTTVDPRSIPLSSFITSVQTRVRQSWAVVLGTFTVILPSYTSDYTKSRGALATGESLTLVDYRGLKLAKFTGPSGTYILVTSHAYVVVATGYKSGTTHMMLTVINPWGCNINATSTTYACTLPATITVSAAAMRVVTNSYVVTPVPAS